METQLGESDEQGGVMGACLDGDVCGGAGGGGAREGPGGGPATSGDSAASGSERKRTQTEKGAEFRKQGKLKKLRLFMSKWRTIAVNAERVITGPDNVELLADARDHLQQAAIQVSDCYHDICTDLSQAEDEKQTDRLETLEHDNLDLIKRISQRIKEIEDERKSQRSRSSQSSRHSSRSQRSQRSEASQSSLLDTAAKVAALKAGLPFAKKLAQQKAELEVLKVQQELDMESARLEVLSQSGSNPINGSTLNVEARVFQPSTPGVDAIDSIRPTTTLPPDHSQVKAMVNDSTTAPQETHVDVATPIVAADYLDEVTQRLAEQVTMNRIPAPEPNIFTGDPLLYPAWKSAFDILIDRKAIPQTEKLYYMRRYLGGSVADMIDGYLLQPTPEAYQAARSLLEERFGDSFTVANAFRDKIDNWPKIAARDSLGLRKFSDFLSQCVLALKSVPSLAILHDERENKKVLQKLPEHLISRWVRIVDGWREQTKSYPPFERFAQFIQKEARVACDPCALTPSLDRRSHVSSGKQQVSKDSRYSRSLASHVETVQPIVTQSTRNCLCCNKSHHTIDECKTFMSKPITERREFATSNFLCFGCLKPGHLSKHCRHKCRCKICSKNHPTPLHMETPPVAGASQVSKVEKVVKASANRIMNQCTSKMTSMVVPVLVSHESNPENEVLVYAMLDSQSDTSFILTDTYKKLKAPGTNVQLLLSTMTDMDHKVSAKRVKGLKVRAPGSALTILVDQAYTREKMPLNKSHIPTPDTVKSWPHLWSLSDQLSPLLDIDVGLLLGYDCPQALVPRQVLPHPENNGPFGQKTDLGWSVVGLAGPQEFMEDHIGVSHKLLTLDTRPHAEVVSRTSIKEILLPSDVIEVLSMDFVECVGPMNGYLGTQSYSQEDVEFLRTMKEGIKTDDDGHYEMPLPLREAGLPLQNNREAALSRLRPLQRRFSKDEGYKSLYTTTMEGLISAGYAEPAKPTQNAWYLPHHGVQQDKKPGKLRLVFDASAKYHGQSLNSCLMQGPDLTNKLLGVLCRFREEVVAVTCDVQAMFHQFKVCEPHRDYLRFLWWSNGDTSQEPNDYRMTVHLFGASSSPSCANFGLRQIVEDHGTKFSNEASQFVSRGFYVDDGLKSVPTEEEAIRLIADTRAMCALAGLHIHKVLSTSEVVMNSLPSEDRATISEGDNVELLQNRSTIERALGVGWNVRKDTLGFQIALKNQSPTRRGILSCVCSVYDPLGLIAPLILGGKRILQDICRDRLDWDEPLDEELEERWVEWRDQLHIIERLSVQRCYKPCGFGEVVKTELHHFSDASTSGYGACSYLRQVNSEGQVHCSLVLGKARVTPLKPTTVPRLELTAAVTASRLGHFLQRELDMSVQSHHFWTDSTAVLGYIHNKTARQEIFVANRVQQIKNVSQSSQWNYVPTSQNPADLASRGCSAAELLNQQVWFEGPKALWSDPISFEHNVSTKYAQEDTVVNATCCSSVSKEADHIITCLTRLSSWPKMKRVLALCRSLRYHPTEAPRASLITPDDLQLAENVIIRRLQFHAFQVEIEGLKAGKPVASNSPIARLDPFLDDNELLRVGGRLKDSNLSFQTRHPLLLPRKHDITDALIRHIHQKSGHQGRSTTVNAIRAAGYWPLHAGQEVSRLVTKCTHCRVKRGEAVTPKMADLPKDRLEDTPPFTNVGVDIFGPFLIKEGRKELKRWGCLFTCLYSRAIHLEVVTTLSTDGFINALRRFVALRGNVKRIRCDQGTNFVGTHNEFSAALSEIAESVRRYFEENPCEFVFNPPSASHMGGVWERTIRTVRSILCSLLKDQGSQLDDDSLRTLMYETAALVNCRPLAIDSLNDPTCPAPLTPNHLLTMKSSVVIPPPGNFQSAELYSKKRWRRVQYLAEVFWTRWRKEYVQQLQQRQRWLRPQRNLEVDDLVLIKEEDLPRGHWRMGRIVRVPTGRDTHVRRVSVAVGDPHLDSKGRRTRPLSILERPAHKLVLILEASKYESLKGSQ